jgi:hypothetical protein
MIRLRFDSGCRRSKGNVLVLAVFPLLIGYFGCSPDMNALTGGRRDASGGVAQGGDCSDGSCAGNSSTGGVPSDGGTAGDSGGASAVGGASASAGSSGLGGNSAGGSTGSGGLSAGAGSSGLGGITSTGGTSASGGQPPTGGAATAGTAGQGDGGIPAPQVHADFETNLQGWLPIGNQRPPDVLDSVTQSTAQAHHGTGSLAMFFDGVHATTVTDPFWGVYTDTNLPPANAQVTFWAFATAAGVSLNIYDQRSPDWLWQSLTTSALLPVGVWTQVQAVIPNNPVLYFGCRVQSSQDYAGTIYLDEISW